MAQQTPVPGREGAVEGDEAGSRCAFASQTPGFKKSESVLMAQMTAHGAHRHVIWA